MTKAVFFTSDAVFALLIFLLFITFVSLPPSSHFEDKSEWEESVVFTLKEAGCLHYCAVNDQRCEQCLTQLPADTCVQVVVKNWDGDVLSAHSSLHCRARRGGGAYVVPVIFANGDVFKVSVAVIKNA